MAPHSSTLAWRIPGTGEPAGLPSIGSHRVGKTRDLFKKIRDTKGTFHAKMGTIKDRNGMDLREAKDI